MQQPKIARNRFPPSFFGGGTECCFTRYSFLRVFCCKKNQVVLRKIVSSQPISCSLLYRETMIITYSVFIFFGSFLTGMIPLAWDIGAFLCSLVSFPPLSLSARPFINLGSGVFSSSFLCCSFELVPGPTKLLMASTVGAGLLIGTALVVVIPEGINTLYSAHSVFVHLAGPASVAPVHSAHVGTSLVSGFLLMLILDKIAAGYGHAHGSGVGVGAQAGHDATQTRNGKYATGWLSWLCFWRNADFSVAMVGLLVHNCVDGFALGISSVSANGQTQSSLGWLVFGSIILHKAPAALALCTFLLQQKKSRVQGAPP
jgi:zinc transporter ZupT